MYGFLYFFHNFISHLKFRTCNFIASRSHTFRFGGRYIHFTFISEDVYMVPNLLKIMLRAP